MLSGLEIILDVQGDVVLPGLSQDKAEELKDIYMLYDEVLICFVPYLRAQKDEVYLQDLVCFCVESSDRRARSRVHTHTLSTCFR